MIILNKRRNKGFIALISAIVISVILLLIAANLSLTSFYGRSNILDSELKEIRSYLEKSENPLVFFDDDHDGLSSYILIKGSVQGPPKRQILLTPPMRATKYQVKKKFEFQELVQ